MPSNQKLLTVENLDERVLRDLFDLKYVAVRVPEFYDATYSKSLADLLYQEIDDSAGSGIYESNIDSFWNVTKNAERQERYFNSTLPLQHRLRRLSAPHPSPIDLLRVTLDENWPGGSTFMSMTSRKMPFGITRLWRTGSEGLPHQDVLHREFDDPMTNAIVGQLGVNIYLDTAEEGGELETWDHVISDEEYSGISGQYPGSYGYPRDMLPDNSVLISPQPGDLVLVNTACVHAIRTITAGRRITLSGFVGNLGPDLPLRCWS
ncbi:2OG-Fe(II) oxygenase [Streptomyces sp. ST2-7A]|uniref:2OG-Fe(II)-dependent halogenase WelO5 family protein n=1 Tax=Streptomyces sp. ST2-7A TaxID=2907214 RepID=UPI001F186EFB|nr:2OG-Fe(II) oxygenase [Streptomyces sp. ST2-7A]MCE7082625.1 2OG-Fe(II) oxygenase [Streptomyces sp. ST2-7A]